MDNFSDKFCFGWYMLARVGEGRINRYMGHVIRQNIATNPQILIGINGKELARYFGISRPSVSQAIKRGEKFAKENDVKLLN